MKFKNFESVGIKDDDLTGIESFLGKARIESFKEDEKFYKQYNKENEICICLLNKMAINTGRPFLMMLTPSLGINPKTINFEMRDGALCASVHAPYYSNLEDAVSYASRFYGMKSMSEVEKSLPDMYEEASFEFAKKYIEGLSDKTACKGVAEVLRAYRSTGTSTILENLVSGFAFSNAPIGLVPKFHFGDFDKEISAIRNVDYASYNPLRSYLATLPFEMIKAKNNDLKEKYAEKSIQIDELYKLARAKEDIMV